MLVGRLDKRVLLQAPVEGGTLSTGEPALAWSTVGEAWASIEDLRGDELVEARKIEARAKAKIVVRYWPGLSCRWRVLWAGSPLGTEKFEIFDVQDRRRRHREMTLLCTEVEGRTG